MAILLTAVTAQGYSTPDVRYVREFGAVGDNATDDTWHLRNALTPSLNGNAKIIDGEHLTCRITGSLTVPAGVTLRNIGLQLATVGMNGVLMSNRSQLRNVKVAGTGTNNVVERGIYVCPQGASDVTLKNVEVSNITYAIHAQPQTTDFPERWDIDAYIHDTVGNGGDFGYGVLLSPASHCRGTIHGVNIRRHALYLSAGACYNDFVVDIDGCGNVGVQLNTFSSQPSSQFNKVVAFMRNLAPGDAGLLYGLACLGNSHYNDFQVFVDGTNNQMDEAVHVEGGYGGPYPTGNTVHDSFIQGTFQSSEAVRLLSAQATRVTNNTMYAVGDLNAIASRRQGSDTGQAVGDWIAGNIINAQGQAITGIYPEVNTGPTFVGTNRVQNNGGAAAVRDNSDGNRYGFAGEYAGSLLQRSISAHGSASFAVSLPDSVSAARVMVSLVAAGTGSSKCSYRIDNFNSTSCSGFTIVVSNTDSTARTVDIHWRVCGDPASILPLILQGIMALRDYAADAAGMPVDVAIRDPGTLTVRQTSTAVLGTGGWYAVTAGVAPGVYDLSAKPSHWLRQTIGGRSLVPGTNTVNFSLINGDCDGDNQVTGADLSMVLASMDSVAGGSADLDADGGVGSTDLSIVLAAMNLAGSP